MSNFKKMIQRGLIGSLMGLFLNMTLLMFAALRTEVLTIQSSELIQYYMIYAVSGFYFSAISIVFNIEEWSLLKQCITHVCLTLPFLPIAHMIGFMPDHTIGRIIFVGMYLSGYVISFIIYKIHLRKQVQIINASLS